MSSMEYNVRWPVGSKSKDYYHFDNFFGIDCQILVDG